MNDVTLLHDAEAVGGVGGSNARRYGSWLVAGGWRVIAPTTTTTVSETREPGQKSLA